MRFRTLAESRVPALRILMATPTFLPYVGGQEMYVLRLSETLAGRGHEITIFTTDAISRAPHRRVVSGRQAIGSLTIIRFPCYAFFYSYLPIAPRLFLALIKKQTIKQHILHAHGFGHFTSDAVGLTRNIRKVPAVLTTHGLHQESGQEGFLRTALWTYYRETLVRSTLSAVDKVVVLSPDELRYLARLGVDLSSKVKVMPIAVAVEDYPKTQAKKPEATRPLILYVGRVDRGKGLEFLIEATARLKRHEPLVMIAGAKTKFAKVLEKLAADRNVTENIAFPGFIGENEKRRLLMEATVFCLPSKYEGASLAVLEAMAAGKPVVASKVGGVPSLVKDASSGYLVRYGDTEALATNLERLITDPELRSRMGQAGRAIAEQHSWPRLADRMEELYLELL